MKHHTKDKGDIGVLKAKADLCKQGFLVLSPESEHAPFDLVIFDDSKFRTVQVKSRSLKNGGLNVSFRSSWTDRHGTHCKAIDKSGIDLYCVYCLDNDMCYYIDPKKFEGSLILRVTFPTRRQKNMHNAEDYRFI